MPDLPIRVMGLEAWKDAAQRGEAPEGAIRKAPDTEIKDVEGERRSLRFTISTGAPDRDRDVIDPDGWDLRHFKKNPVVMFAHDYRALPIARATKIEIEDGKLIAETEFATADMNPLAESVYLMLRGGFLSGTSVGFKPKKYIFNETRRGVDFQEQELLEFSIVPVPVNPECLIVARAAGIDVEPVRAWAKALLGSQDAIPVTTGSSNSSVMGSSVFILETPSVTQIEKQDGFEVQSVLFPKMHWDSAGACRDWLNEHDFKSGDLDETDDHYRFRQRDPGDFERLRTICLMPTDMSPGNDRCRIKAIGGPVKAIDEGLHAGVPTGGGLMLELECLDDVVLELEEDESDEVRYAIDPMDIRAALAETVGEGVRRAINALKGRVD